MSINAFGATILLCKAEEDVCMWWVWVCKIVGSVISYFLKLYS